MLTTLIPSSCNAIDAILNRVIIQLPQKFTYSVIQLYIIRGCFIYRMFGFLFTLTMDCSSTLRLHFGDQLTNQFISDANSEHRSFGHSNMNPSVELRRIELTLPLSFRSMRHHVVMIRFAGRAHELRHLDLKLQQRLALEIIPTLHKLIATQCVSCFALTHCGALLRFELSPMRAAIT